MVSHFRRTLYILSTQVGGSKMHRERERERAPRYITAITASGGWREQLSVRVGQPERYGNSPTNSGDKSRQPRPRARTDHAATGPAVGRRRCMVLANSCSNTHTAPARPGSAGDAAAIRQLSVGNYSHPGNAHRSRGRTAIIE